MKKPFAKALFLSFALFAVTAHSNEETERTLPFERGENIVVNSRPLSPQKKMLMEKNRQEELERTAELEEEDFELTSLMIPIKDKDFITLASQSIPQTPTIASSSLYHWIDYFPQDNIVKTEDGAEWVFDKNDNYIMHTWRSGDAIVISPKGRWLWGSNYAYIMTNKTLGTSVDVNLFLGPIAFGSYSTWIIGIDQNNGQVYLLNGQGERTIWEISNVDLYLFKDWEVNDTLIIGQNDSWLWWFSSYNHILVNVNMNHFVRARQISSTPHYLQG